MSSSSTVSKTRLAMFILPATLVIALAIGIFLPGTVLADGNSPGPKVAVQQMDGRPGYQGNPWAQAQPSCSSNRYYNQYPQRRPPSAGMQPQNNMPPRQMPHQQNPNNWGNWNSPPPSQNPNNWGNWTAPRHPQNPNNPGNWNGNCGGFTYVVRRGDTISSISRRFGLSQQELARANGLRNPNRIYAGQRLWIPSGYCK
jgi:hypothetical protein